MCLSLCKSIILNIFQYFRVINSKTADTNFIKVEIDKLSNERFNATICCPFCSRIISLFHAFQRLANWHNHEQRWNTADFDDHLKTHQNDGGDENCE